MKGADSNGETVITLICFNSSGIVDDQLWQYGDAIPTSAVPVLILTPSNADQMFTKQDMILFKRS